MIVPDGLFLDPERPDCPPLTNDRIVCAEDTLSLRLPEAYLDVLRVCNGGKLRRNTYFTQAATSWAKNYIQVESLLGIGGERGIDSRYGSAYLIEEWGFPSSCVVLWAKGPLAVMLDYRECGPEGDPPIIWVDMDAHQGEQIVSLAPNFQTFIEELRPL